MIKNKIYSEVELSRVLPINYSELEGKEYFIIAKDKTPDVFLWCLDNAYVSPYGVVYHNLKVVQDSVFHGFRAQNHYFTLIKKVLLRRVRRVKGKSIIATHAYYDNYYHFTAECLPRLFLMKDFANEAQLLVHESLPAFAKEYISMLGYNNLIYIKDKEIVWAEKLLFCTHVANSHSHNPLVLANLIPFLKSNNQVVKDFSSYKNIYISRKKASSRKLVNESEVIELIKEYDFKVVYLEDYSVAEQIALFSYVKNLICVHGAGTTNIMYMPEGGLVIELINIKHFAPFFYNLANIFNHDTIYIRGTACPDTQNPIRDNFEINLSQLKEYLDRQLK